MIRVSQLACNTLERLLLREHRALHLRTAHVTWLDCIPSYSCAHGLLRTLRSHKNRSPPFFSELRANPRSILILSDGVPAASGSAVPRRAACHGVRGAAHVPGTTSLTAFPGCKVHTAVLNSRMPCWTQCEEREFSSSTTILLFCRPRYPLPAYPRSHLTSVLGGSLFDPPTLSSAVGCR